MVENNTKEYNLTDTSTNKKMKNVIAHEYSKKTNVVGKKYSYPGGGWKKEKVKEDFSVAAGPKIPRLSDMTKN